MILNGPRFWAIIVAIAFVSAACSGDDDIARAPGFDGETITVGAISTVDGILAPVGQAMTAGNRLYWDELNAQGGVPDATPSRCASVMRGTSSR